MGGFLWGFGLRGVSLGGVSVGGLVWGLFFNKAMEYFLLRVFVQGNNQNAENKAYCTRHSFKRQKKIESNGEDSYNKWK